MLVRASVCCLLSAIASACWACRAPPTEQLVSPSVQLALTIDVTLATAVEARSHYDNDRNVGYQFLVLKRFAGPDEKTFSIVVTHLFGYNV